MTRLRCLIAFQGAFLALFSASVARAGFDNGDFSAGLASWTAEGDVAITGGAAALGDNGAARSTLYQAIAWTPASFVLQFDFNNALSSVVPEGVFPDVFFASVYFVNDLGGFNLDSNTFDDSVGLFDLSAAGVRNLHAGSSLGASPLGADWTRLTAALPSGYNYVIPVFELFDQNFLNGESRVLVDNAVLLIPEPAPLALLALVGLPLALRLRRRGAAAVPRDPS